MQETRRYILDILKEYGEATVDDIVSELQKRRSKDITAVTVRHHLARLQRDNLIDIPQMRHRNTPGRPQHIYALTEQAMGQYPNNYQNLAGSLLQCLRDRLPADRINVILEDVADRMAHEAHIPDVPLEDRLNHVVEYLNRQGYSAHWQEHDGGYLLYTSNCPYHQLAQEDDTMCEMDMRLVASLLGAVPRRVEHVMAGDNACTYMIPHLPRS
ncbi:MAG: ArsR family transcriptional regulator [Anaerolineae bacterium]|nr:ArsR family transcriptional regulator [Anaerolineae bacterium]